MELDHVDKGSDGRSRDSVIDQADGDGLDERLAGGGRRDLERDDPVVRVDDWAAAGGGDGVGYHEVEGG